MSRIATKHLTHGDIAELKKFQCYLDDIGKLSESEMVSKYAEYLHLSQEEVQAIKNKEAK